MDFDVVDEVGADGLLEQVLPLLLSPCCKAKLTFSESDCVCDSCGHTFERVADSLNLRLDSESDAEKVYAGGIRSMIRRRPWLYRFVRHLSPTCAMHPNPKRVFGQQISSGQVILDIGSGNMRYHPAFVNVDISQFNEANVIADACDLPFRDSSVDGILSIVSLEHINRSGIALKEFSRVLKPGGLSFIVVPFMQPLHSSPSDFRRWTIAGLTEDLESVGIEVVRSGLAAGPASTMAWMTAEFLSLILSLGIRRVRSIITLPLQVLCSPFKWLDILLARMPGAEVLASAIWVEAIRMKEHDTLGELR